MNQSTSTNTTNQPQREEPTTMLAVSTVPQTIAKGAPFEEVSASAKTTKEMKDAGQELAAADRYRGIVVPEYTVNTSEKWQAPILLDCIRKLAAAQLKEMWVNDPNIREVPAAAFSVQSLVLYHSRVVESTRLSSASIAEWFLHTDMHTRILAKMGPEAVASYSKLFAHCAAAVITHDEKQKAAMARMIRGNEDDADSLIGSQILAKLEKVAKSESEFMEAV